MAITSYIAPTLVFVLAFFVAITSERIRILVLLIGLIPLLATYIIEFNFTERLYLNGNEQAYENTISDGYLVLDKNKALQEDNFENITSCIQMTTMLILVSSLGIIFTSNYRQISSKYKLFVRSISFIIILLFLMPMYGAKHVNYGGVIHAHFIWQSKNSYIHIH